VNQGLGYAVNPFTNRMEWVGRLKRPGYYCDSAGTEVKIDASPNQLVQLLIGNRVYLLKESLVCNLAHVGPGGLDAGAITAATPYYLYAIIDSRKVQLIASVRPPGEGGPQGYSPWSYIGAMMTERLAATFRRFNALNGVFRCTRELFESSTLTGTTTATQMTVTCPVTAKVNYIRMFILQDGTLVNGGNYVLASSDGNALLTTIVHATSTIGITTYGDIPHLVQQSIWLRLARTAYQGRIYLYGWQEDPMIYP